MLWMLNEHLDHIEAFPASSFGKTNTLDAGERGATWNENSKGSRSWKFLR